MKLTITHFLSIIIGLTILSSCTHSTKLYKNDNKEKTYTGKLEDSTYNSLKQFLTSSTNQLLKDTLIIKYDYNNETCWGLLDKKEDEYVMGFITRHKERVQQVLLARQNVSIFDFREAGTNINKIKKWDNSILIDSSKTLFNLLFKERCTCGSSIIVMPDRRFVFLRSDSHSEAMDLTQKQIGDLLNKK